MLLDLAFNLKQESETVVSAIKNALVKGFGTEDIVAENPLTTTDFAGKILDSIG